MSIEFDISFTKSGRAEGSGWSNRSADRGGETYRGISRPKNPDWPGWTIIDKAKDAPGFPRQLEMDPILNSMVVAFYRALWVRLRCQSMPTQELADIVFDTAIICGETTAVIYLQRSLNVLNREAKSWPDVEVDGKLGAVTIAIANKAVARVNSVVAAIVFIRGYRHIELAEKQPDQEDNENGWILRLIDFIPDKGV
jgi:lysozyme family protein